jgi:23S rRNA (adenine2503-C2)-methyltransferase
MIHLGIGKGNREHATRARGKTMIELGEETEALSMAPERPVLLGLDKTELSAFATAMGQPAFRGRQLARWIYLQGAREFGAMTDLPAGLRDELAARANVGRSPIVAEQRATDGTTKLLLELRDGRQIETVMLPYADRTSVCISSQVGCPVGCVFCATATMGFARNLTAGEMVDQVLAAGETARASAPQPRVSHVVVMGMGEPLLNVPALLKAATLMHDEMGLSLRHLTVSTVGYVPGIRALADAGLPITLALSLHAPDDALRAKLIPMSKRYGLDEVLSAVRHYQERTGRRVTLEYLVLGGVNDSEAQARELARRVRGLMTHVNLIPWNPAETLSPFHPPSRNRVRDFRHVLERAGLTVTQRMERGQEIDAACGQLAVKTERARRSDIADRGDKESRIELSADDADGRR